MQRITLRVSGMTCMGCVNSVKNLLGAVAGVRGVEVDLASGQATVDIDPSQTGVQALRDAIQEGGYQVVD